MLIVLLATEPTRICLERMPWSPQMTMTQGKWILRMSEIAESRITERIVFSLLMTERLLSFVTMMERMTINVEQPMTRRKVILLQPAIIPQPRPISMVRCILRISVLSRRSINLLQWCSGNRGRSQNLDGFKMECQCLWDVARWLPY